jgi:predicted MPP superfamily phosphohydrolase
MAAWSVGGVPVRVVHVSDLQTVGPCERNRRAVELINELEPDLVVVTGDFVAGPFGEPEPLIEEARLFLGSLRAPLGVVVVEGHSDLAWIRTRIFEGLGLTHLTNETVLLEVGEGRRLRIFGVPVHDPDLTVLEPWIEPGLVTLVASHMPDLSYDLDGKGVDLHLAGHTHGGQVALPFIGAPFTLSALPRKYARGLHEIGDHRIHVNAGIGMEGNHAPRIRFACPPQIDLLLLQGTGERLGGNAGPP